MCISNIDKQITSTYEHLSLREFTLIASTEYKTRTHILLVVVPSRENTPSIVA